MNDPVTARDVMNRSYVGVSESDTVAGAAEVMQHEGVDAAVVLRGSNPVGMIAATDIVNIVADGRDPAETRIEAAMTETLLSIDADQRLDDAISALADNDVRHVLVMDNGDIAGMLSEHDIVTAQTMIPTMRGNGPSSVTPDVDANLDSGEVSSQGVCEICGSLSRNLADVNGQVVCQACREV